MQTNRTHQIQEFGIRALSLLLVVSFAFIPVRCDASAVPHSIFVSPNALGGTGHEHHTAMQADRPQTIPHHSPDIPDMSVAGEHHHSISDDGNGEPDPGTPEQLATSTDTKSQQPVGAALEMPVTSIILGSAVLRPLDRESALLRFGPISMLSGIVTAPEAPPPEIV